MLLLVVGAFIVIMIIGYAAGNSPQADEVAQARATIDTCWAEQKRKSIAPGEARFIAGVCEKLENEFRQKYNRSP